MVILTFKSAISDRGFSLLEMLVVLSMAGIMMGIGISNLNLLSNPSVTSVNQIQGIIKLARSRAISTTSPYIVAPDGYYRVVGRKATTCTDTEPVTDPRVRYDLPLGISLMSNSWSICFTSRGIADSGIDIAVKDSKGAIKTIEVMRGGAVRIKTS